MIANLPTPARRLILWVTAVACVIIASAISDWNGVDPRKLGLWMGLAALAGTAKLRLPGIESSYSFGYIVVLAAMSMLRFPEAVLVGIATAVVQCYWRPAKRPTGIQVRFNLFNYAISAAASWYAFHGLKTLAPEMDLAPCFVLGACTFFVINSGLVSWIVGILSGRRPFEVWETSHLPIFPYYLFGAGCAAILGWRTQLSAWLLLAMLPLLALLYESMRLRVRKAS